MNIKSIRFRLTLWYTLAFSLAAVVIFVSFYYVTTKAFYRETDASLSSHLQKILEVVSRQDSSSHQMMAKEIFLSEFNEIPGMLVIIMDNNGNIISSSQTVKQTENSFSQIYDMLSIGMDRIFINRHVGNTLMRFLASPIIVDGELRLGILIAHPMDVIQNSLNELLITLVVVFIIFIIPTFLGGYLLARSAMQPITDIAEKIKQISSENLKERVPNPHTKDELEELANTFNSLLNRISLAFVRERQFLADVAHQLKTPIATVKSNIEVTLSKSRNITEYKNVLDETLLDINKLAKNLESILNLAWYQSDTIPGKSHEFSLSDLLNELVEISQKLAVQKKIKVEGRIDKDIKIRGFTDRLSLGLLNIIDNAIKYTPQQGKITISLFKKKNNAVIQITDTGIGIPGRDLSSVFDRFYRGSNARDESGGTGLGLSISKAIIEVLHGKISLKSQPQIGTTVTVSLPIFIISS